MSEKQTNKDQSEANSLFKNPEFGIKFFGLVVSIGEIKPWKDRDSKEVIGRTLQLGLSDGSKIYTYSCKKPDAENMPKFNLGQKLEVVNVTTMSDMGQHRIIGDAIA